MANVNLREYYKNTVVPGMLKSDDYSSIMAVPRLEKIVLVSAGMLIMGMANMIFMLLSNTQ